MTAAARKEKEERRRGGAFFFHHPSPPLRWECRQRTVKSGRRDAGFISPPVSGWCSLASLYLRSIREAFSYIRENSS
jgi:hypothetical protein